MILPVAVVLLAVPATLAQTVALWGQCGGLGYTGGTTCASGSYCYVQNAYYSQCLPGTASTTLATSTTVTPTTGTSTVSSSATSATASSSAVPKYIFSFGDSYSQTGFDITGTKPSASNPIGNPTFPGYTSSGGTNWLGYLVTQYNPTTALSYNFASGGAGINTTIISTYGTPLTTQVATFLSNLGSKPSYAPWTSTDSLFVFWIGINDIGNSYYLSVDQDALHTQLMDTIFNLVQQLYAVGAKNFLFMSVPPIEKTPLMIAQSTSSALALEAAQIADFNSKLVSRAAAWNQGKSQTSIYQFDTQVPFNQIIASPATYGYSDATSVCQTSACMWWDTYHPSTGVHKVIAEQVATLLKTGFW